MEEGEEEPPLDQSAPYKGEEQGEAAQEEEEGEEDHCPHQDPRQHLQQFLRWLQSHQQETRPSKWDKCPLSLQGIDPPPKDLSTR